MRQICLRLIFNMYINDASISQRIKGHRMTFTYLEYGSNFEIFYTNIYSELSFKLYLSAQIYTHIRTCFTIAVITNIFIKQSINIGEGGSKNIKGYHKIYICSVYKTYL